MNIIIARGQEECAGWTGPAVVVDVLGTSTTLCVLLKKSGRTVLLCSDEPTAQALAAKYPDYAVLSSVDLSMEHEDESPYLAHKLSSRRSVLRSLPRSVSVLQKVPVSSIRFCVN